MRFLMLWLCLFGLFSSFVSPAAAQFGGELIAFESPGNTTYYLDAEKGDDENPGTRPETAWRTLGRINTSRFAPGDSILIKAGTSYDGKLWPKGTGIPGRPVTIGSYGEGARPAIHGKGKTSATLFIENSNAWHIQNLEITNTGDKPEAFRYGVSILIEDLGVAGDFELTDLLVHDVNGSDEPGLGEGAGIIWRNRGSVTPTRFDGVLVERCEVRDCGRNGIVGESGLTDRSRWAGNANVVVRESRVERVNGDGIRLTGCTNAMVEYNTVVGAGGGGAGGASVGEAGGIAIADSDNTIVQFNEVKGSRSRDCAALWCGPNSRENTFQFNLTLDNAGPMAALTAGPTDATGQGAGNVKTLVRYNISQDDDGVLWVSGPVREAMLQNNTAYTGADSLTVGLRVSDKAGAATDLAVVNNVFFTAGRVMLDLDGSGADTGGETTLGPGARFRHNAWFGEVSRPGNEENPVTDDPQLVDPGKAVSRSEGVEGYQTQPGSPLRGAGVRLPGHGLYDFWSDPVAPGAAVDIGAYQAPSDNQAPPSQTVTGTNEP